jgi:hypothetical protein
VGSMPMDSHVTLQVPQFRGKTNIHRQDQSILLKYQGFTQRAAFFIFNPTLFPTNSLFNPFSKSVAMKSNGSSREVA